MFWLGFILCSNVMHTAIVTLLFLATDKLCVLSFLIFLGAWYGSSGNYRNITGNLTLFCSLGTVPTNRSCDDKTTEFKFSIFVLE